MFKWIAIHLVLLALMRLLASTKSNWRFLTILNEIVGAGMVFVRVLTLL